MSAIKRAARSTTPSGAESISELWRGYVVEVFSDSTASVVVPQLSGNDPVGRIPSLVRNLAIDAAVIVGAIEGRRDDLVVISAVSFDGLVIGDARFTDVLLDNAPTNAAHATRKDYVDAQVATRALAAHGHSLSTLTGNLNFSQLPLFIEIGNAVDLNVYITDGIWHQSQNAEAATGSNYPTPNAGLLIVRVSGNFIYQTYFQYNTSRVHNRMRYNSVWTSWQAGAFVSELVNVTSSVNGFMLAADKVKLDAASSTTANNTLVLRTASGHINANVFLSDAAQSASVNAMTRRDYVDAQIATRAAAVHTHLWADLTDKPATFPATAHNHTAAEISDSTAVGRSLMTAADAAAARSAIGAGTSSLALGTTSSTAKAGNWFPSFAEVTGMIGTSQLPPLAINDTFPVASQAAMLALTAQRGDMAIRSDNGRTYVLSTDSPGTLADWKEVLAAGQVQSVAGKTGVVSLVKGDVGLGNVDNTTDVAKPVSTAQQTALNLKLDSADNWGYLISAKPATDLASTYPTGMSMMSIGSDATWPLTLATVFTVRPAGARTYQTLAAKNSGRIMTRVENDTPGWSAWAESASTAAVTSSVNGLMIAADKALLDAATSSATANTLAERASDGGIQFFRVVSTDTGTPSSSHLVRKDWVDSQVSPRTLGKIAGLTSATLSASLTTTKVCLIETTAQVITGRTYAIRATIEFYGETAGDIAVGMELATGGTAGSANGTTRAAFTVWGAPGSTQGATEQRIGEWTADITGTARFKMNVYKAAGTGNWKSSSCAISIIDEGVAP